MTKIKTVFVLLLAGCAGKTQINVAPATIVDGPTGDGVWHWIDVEPDRSSTTGWLTVTGVADVQLNGSRLHAELKPGAGQSSEGLSLDGRVVGDRVQATEILLNTDANRMEIHGTVRRTTFGNDITEERIVFRDGQAGDASYLALQRSTRNRP